MTRSTLKAPFVLIVLDGWGHSEKTEHNAIALARTPHWDNLWQCHPGCLISCSGKDVGLPEGQMGNSEVGHMTLGSGRVVDQDFTRISKAIIDGSFYQNAAFKQSIKNALDNQGKVHILGLLSPGGVHSHEQQIKAAVQMAFKEGAQQVYLHAFLDGRDVPPKSALSSIRDMDEFIRSQGKGGIASIAGRYYAMDRDNRWDRVEAAYDLLTGQSTNPLSATAELALTEAYERGETDEFVRPTAICLNSENLSSEIPGDNLSVMFPAIEDRDSVIYMNFRSDRARQLTRAFVDSSFDGFTRKRHPKLSSFATLTEYAEDIDAQVAFGPVNLPNSLGEYLASLGKTQLRLAETEKYAHVTFFFSAGREVLFEGEQRQLIPSPKVATYDLEPAMSAHKVTHALVRAIKSGDFDLIVCNFANGDMVGHTGNLTAAKKAVECIDECLGIIVKALKDTQGQCLITADHGNVEKMADLETGQPHTAHTSELVPFVYLGHQPIHLLATDGTLADVAPSLLDLMGIPQPGEMTGKSLILREDNLDEDNHDQDNHDQDNLDLAVSQ